MHETKSGALRRAKRIQFLHNQIADVPCALERAAENIAAIEHFIKRSLRSEFDANDHDALLRMPWSFEEMDDVPPHEAGPWSRNEALYTNRLHPVTITKLNEAKELVYEERTRIETQLPVWRAELAELRSFGLLPLDIASRFKLTREGELTPRPAQLKPLSERALSAQEVAIILPGQLELFALL